MSGAVSAGAKQASAAAAAAVACGAAAAKSADLGALQVLTLDVGGSAIKYGVCNGLGELTHKGHVPTPNSVDSTVQDLLGAIAGICTEVKAQGASFEGLAISLPGCVNPDGSMRTGGAILYNYGQPLADLVEEATGMRPVLENDAKAAAAAELWIGALQNVQSGAVLILGTGLGGGLVINGKVYHGPRGSAGELSAFVHNCPSFSGDLDCEASHVSATGLVLQACEALGLEYNFSSKVAERKLPLDGKKIFELYHEGNEVIHQVLEDFGFAVGKLIFNLSVVLDLDRVAIGGGISAQDCLIEAIVRGTKKAWQCNPISDVTTDLIHEPEVVVCKFHNDANLVGAMHQYLDYHHYL